MTSAPALAWGIALACVAALTTATSHSLLKAGQDGMAVRAMCSVTWMVAALVPALLMGLPERALWPWLAGAVALHGVYSLILTWSYGLNDFSVAFPIARGTAPAVTAIGGTVLLHDQLSLLAIIGIAAISTGILLLVQGQAIGRRGLVAALCSGLLTASYTLVDAGGMRAGQAPFTFICWFFLLLGSMLLLQFLVARRAAAWALLRRDARVGLQAGIVSLLSFGATLFALRLAPVGIVSALRETCVLVSLVIAWRVLGERMSARKIAAGLAITAGALTIIAG